MSNRLHRFCFRTVTLLLACVLLLCMFSACSGTKKPEADPTDTTYDTSTGLAYLVSLVGAPDDSAEIQSVYFVNLENDLVLHQKQADTPQFPAASVKIMTGLIACRQLEGRLDETVTITAAMLAGASGRQMKSPLQVGEIVTVRDLLYATICGSYNDAATVLACYTSGSVSDFVEDMNAEAERIGAVNTHYTNPTGLHDAAMVTTAYDTAKITRAALDIPLYQAICAAHSYDMPATNLSPARSYGNRNDLLDNTYQNQYYAPNCYGVSAGYTDEGGGCVVGLWKSGGASNLCVLMGSRDANGTADDAPAYNYARDLFNWARDQFSYRAVIPEDYVFDEVKVALTGTSKSRTELTAAKGLSLYLPRRLDVEQLSVTYRLHDGSLSAPLTAGHEVGVAVVSLTGQNTSDTVLGTVPVTVKEAYAINPFLRGMSAFRRYLTSRAFVAAVICFTILLLVYLKWTSTPGGRYGLRSARRRRRLSRRRR